ncbi:hypothetical protein Ddye_004115 [Dipteronia dyeriana]|uniref:Dirigent protein n=1 Tax=Dipteronia dyeriana TaxID=168575 RepID=A0AAD9XU55_9ROSI|nr:hypothetical protein Ddye_004115 [Dipteronia dyeriana]
MWAAHRGLYGSASQAELGLIMVFNFDFTEGMYKGSSISILGLNSAMNPVWEMAIIGGTGIFLLAQCYAIAQTHWFDHASGDAIVGFQSNLLHNLVSLTKGLFTLVLVLPRPICRTVADVVHVLDAIAGFDYNDPATKEASKYIPYGGYVQFLKPYGLTGKRLGVVRSPFFKYAKGSALAQYEHHLRTLRQEGAVLVDHLEIANIDVILNVTEKIEEFGQDISLLAQATNGIGNTEKAALLNLAKLSRDGFEKVMMENSLDALVTPGAGIASFLAIGGFPGISVPAGFTGQGVPFGFSFGGLKGTEPKLIEIAYGFEHATMIRMPPSFKPSSFLYP